VVPYGIDLSRFAVPDAAAVAALRQRYGEPLLLFVGRLRYYKGLHFLLAALPLLRRPAHLLLVGIGPEEQRLRALVQALGLDDRVHFLGEVSDAELPAVYRAADVFVLPSHLRAEAFGIVQLEAQAAGLPVVCTELGTGTSYVTQHGITGLVVPPADPPALARALDVLLANPTLARQMGAQGQARAHAEFSHERMLQRYLEVYADICPASRC
jgi:rhamnosyl/mannosyltransferase